MNRTKEAGAGGAAFPASLRERIAAQTVMTEFLRAHGQTGPRSAMARAFGSPTLSDESSLWFARALAELTVGDALAELGPDWFVLHAVPLDACAADIDHIVIGPGGVFTLSTKNYSDESVRISRGVFGVSGARRDDIRASELEVGRVERVLGGAITTPLHVMGVIVVVNARSISVSEMPRDVTVLGSDELVDWLRNRPVALSSEDVLGLAMVAEKPATWLSGAVLLQDSERLRAEFDAAREEVARARSVRRTWHIAITSVLISLIGLAVWGIVLVTTTDLIAR